MSPREEGEEALKEYLKRHAPPPWAYERENLPRDTLSAYPLSRLRKNRELTKKVFRRGETLDLHHHTRREAEKVLLHALAHWQRKGARYARIITGKGNHAPEGGVLREFVQELLSRHPQVVEFSFAPPWDGGEGVLWVRLRRQGAA